MPQPITLPLNCPKCRRPLSISLQLPRNLAPNQAPMVCIIPCPYEGCDGHIDPKLHGEIAAIWPGHGQQPKPSTIH